MLWGEVWSAPAASSRRALNNRRWIWQIALDSAEFGKAARILRLYCIENRQRVPREIESPKLIFDWGNLWFFALLVVVFALRETTLPALREVGVMSAGFFHGQWWRPFTAVLLHADAAHLASNTAIGLVFVGLAGGMFGTWRALGMSYLCGIAAYIVGAALKGTDYRALGASGMVMGALGLLTAFSLAHFHKADRRKWILRGLAGGMLLLVMLGFDPRPRTDVLAHVSGFAFGVLFGGAKAWFDHRAAQKTEM
jgi:rhomboid protease GluP